MQTEKRSANFQIFFGKWFRFNRASGKNRFWFSKYMHTFIQNFVILIRYHDHRGDFRKFSLEIIKCHFNQDYGKWKWTMKMVEREREWVEKKHTHTVSEQTKLSGLKFLKCVCESFSKLKNHLKHITAYIFAIAKDIVFATAMKIDNWRTHIQSLVLNVAVGKTQCSTSDVFSIRCLNRFFGKSFFHSTKYKVYLSNEFSDRK